VAIDLAPSADSAALAERTAAFVRDVVIPVELAQRGVASAEDRTELQRAAIEAGLFAPHVPAEYGGHGLNMTDRAAVFEAAGYSLLGPLALNIAAPDEGNMHLLEAVGRPEQKERYLRPLAAGRSTATSGSSPAPTGRPWPSAWPAPPASRASPAGRRCS
jgi:acyl-CoA dehydrogenase